MIQGLTQCPNCNGFVPPKAIACPHCRPATVGLDLAAPLREGSWAKRTCAALMATASGGLLMTTLMACYGAPYDCEVSPEDLDGDCTPNGQDCEPEDPNIDRYLCENGSNQCGSACQQREDTCEDNQGTCLGFCLGLTAPQPEEVDTAILACVSQEACDENTIPCIFERLYPDGTTYPTFLSGTNLRDFEGATIYGATQHVGGPWQGLGASSPIVDGAFRITVETTGPIAPAPTFAWYIDVNANGVCDPSADLSGTTTELYLGGGFDNPSYGGFLRGVALTTSCVEPFQ